MLRRQCAGLALVGLGWAQRVFKHAGFPVNLLGCQVLQGLDHAVVGRLHMAFTQRLAESIEHLACARIKHKARDV